MSCKKDVEVTPPPAQKKYSIITTGILYNTAANTYNAYYWKNEERIALPSGNSTQAFSYGIDKRERDLFIAGSYAGKHPESGNDVLMPCYWINGVKKNLPVNDLVFYKRAAASDVKWFNGAWYVSGDYDLIPILWKISGNEVEIIHLPVIDTTVVSCRKTSNIEIYNDRLYIGGSRQKAVNDKYLFDIGFWTINNTGKTDFYIVEDNLLHALPYFILPTQVGIYISGEYSKEPGNSKPVIWTPNGKMAYIDQLNPTYNRVRSIAMNNKNELFAVLHNIQTYQPLLNKVQHNGTHEEILPVVPVGAKGLSKTLSVLNDQVAYSYIYELSGSHFAELVFNNKKSVLNIDNNASANFHRTVIFEE